MSDTEERERSRDRERSRRERPSRFSEPSRDRSPDRGKDRAGLKASHCRVYVSNIPYEYRWQDLKDLFRSNVGDVSFVELFVDENEKPRGCGIVEFSDTASVKKCLEVMHRFELKGRKLVIKEDFGNQRDKYGNLVGSAASRRVREREEGRDHRGGRDDRHGGFDLPPIPSGRQESAESKWGNTYGLSPQFLETLWITSPLINRVFVANLDYKVNKKKLKEIFRLAGKVQKVDISVDKDGKSRGFAVIEYDHPVEAVQAISMFHNQSLFDRLMTVRMDREGDRQLKLPEGLKGVGMGLGINGEPLRDVARNLPSITNNPPTAQLGGGAGILGAVPNSLGINNAAAALTNLNSAVNSSALNNAAVLQAANLAGVGGLSNNLLANSLGGGDLGLAASLVQNQSLAALASSGNLNASSVGGFNRGDSSNSFMGGNQNSAYPNSGMQQQNQNYGGGNRNYQNSYDSQKSGFNFGGSDRDSRSAAANIYSSVNNGSQMLRSGGSITGGKNNGFSSKVIISNLPPTASYKMLSEKCSEFGDVQRVEDKGSGSVLVSFATEWEAERAIKNMDRARIDGRTIDVRFFY